MRNMKKVLALLLAMVMVMSMGIGAFADETENSGEGGSGTEATTATGALKPDTEMTVGGLEEKDDVKFYKLIKWVEGTGWAWADGVETAATTAGVTLPTLKTITGWTTPAPATAGVISAADGGILAQVAQKLTAVHTETVASGKSSVTYTNTADSELNYVGLYVALVSPANPEYLYNPIFVAADYNPDNTNTNSITVEEGALSYQPAAMAKKEKIPFTKKSGTTADVQYDVAVGDTIPFTIDSVVPEFSTSYQDPVYEISDTMSTGLELDKSTIVVKVREKGSTGDFTNLTAGTDYTLTSDTTSFTVALKSAYLKANNAAKEIQVTYSAKVTKIDDTNVVQKENKATVKFSNDPGDSRSYSLLEDKTNHYTFSLDANLLGNDEWENSELVKIGLNPDGTEITQETLSNGTSAGVLEGATFGLYTDEACSTLYTNTNVTPAVDGKYVSDANGKLNISGLDAGTYYLQEISAPAGYIKDTTIYEIKITPTYETVAAGSYTNGDGILVKYDAYDYLVSYKVEVKNMTTNTTVKSDFTITNEGTEKKTATSSTGSDTTTKLNNTQGTELPSTGGIGTTLFYMVGSVLVISAVVLLISKRRMNNAR